MNTREAFEAALDEDPSDQVTRAIYADWLGQWAKNKPTLETLQADDLA